MKSNKLIIAMLTILLASCTPRSSSSNSTSGLSDTSTITSDTGTPTSEEPPSVTSEEPPSITSETSTSTSEPVSNEIAWEALNSYFDFDVYSQLPKIYSSDYDFFDNSSPEYPIDIYIDLFDWSEADAIAYDQALAAKLADGGDKGYVIADNLYVYIYLEEQAYDLPTYSINIYSFPVTVTPEPRPDLTTGTPSVLSGTQTINDYQKLVYNLSGMPSLGNIDVLVIPVEIYGSSFPSDYLTKLELLFNGSSASAGWESVASFYTKSSYGQLNLHFDIAPKSTTIVGHDGAYFAGFGEAGDEYAISEVMDGISGIDFSHYDYNNDGLLDGVIYVYSVDYNYDVDPWWAWVYSGQYFTQNPTPVESSKALGYYMWVSYSFIFDTTLAFSTAVNPETYIHEFGHLLGAADLYSTTHNSGPLGGWDMMDYNAGDHGPINKLLWGWLDPLVAAPGYEYTINLDSYSLDDNGENSAILIPHDSANFADGNAFDEYLLVIYYTPNGLYQGHLGTYVSLSTPGIVVYHVDARLASNANEWSFFMNSNDGANQFLAEVLEADKNSSIPSDDTLMQNSDLLHTGLLDLVSYQWNQGGLIDVTINVDAMTSTSATLTISVY